MRWLKAILVPPGSRLELSAEDLKVSLGYARRLARNAPSDVESSIGVAQPMSMIVYGEAMTEVPIALLEMLHSVGRE